jgi:rod shape determining protein RodA
MWRISRLDWAVVPITISLMIISLLVISSMSAEEADELQFWTPLVKTQLRWFCLGWGLFFACAAFDYRRLRDWSLPLYLLILALLAGLFFVGPIQNVHRWYRIPGLMSFQPSEQAKIALILALSWFLERKGQAVGSFKTALQMGLLVGVPFLLIAKQPDLGTALVLFPISLVMGYFAGIHPLVLRFLNGMGALLVLLTALLFTGIWSHEEMRPYFTTVLKQYQYERLNPHTYHQEAAATAIALGGMTGSGWGQSEFSHRKWLPAAYTDSVFAAFGEEFGFVGLVILLSLFYGLLYRCFQVAAVAKDPFGRLLAAGLSAYIAMHVLVNSAMMCSLLPITGVPLLLVTYGGSSLLTTMAALGLLQSVYSRRFMF